MFLERTKITLPAIQKKMLKSAWQSESVDSVTLEKMSYLSDGLKVKGYLAYPKNTGKKYPCIIFCRGGYADAGALDDFYAQGILGQIAGWGYVVFETQYRGNDGGEGKDEFGGNDVNDVLNLIALADELEFANKEVWGIEGWSRGGMMTYLTLTKNHNFKAAISSGGISNLTCSDSENKFLEKLLKHYGSKLNEELCYKRSIINFTEKFSKTTPLLILHGLNDTRVLPQQSLDLSYKLIKQNIEHRLILLENGDHFLRSHKKEVDEFRKNWFNKYLK